MTEKIEMFISNVKLIEEGLEETDAFASVTLNPTLRWMKFILTDDIPNGNKQKVPQEEFSSLISTGVHMPIKMAQGEIKPGHDEALPLGVITNLKQFQNRIEGLAALWSRERPEDVELVINEFKAGRAPQISWEIPYTDIVEKDGIQELRGICLRAATLVGLPAYAGRTPVLAVASKDNTEDKISMEELETLKVQLEEAKAKITELQDQLAEKEKAASEVEAELTQLREFKAAFDKEQAEVEKLAAIKAKFTEAGIEKEDEYFATNKEALLTLDETALNFMIQELVAFTQAAIKPDPKDNTDIPIPFNTNNVNPSDLKSLAEALRARKTKK